MRIYILAAILFCSSTACFAQIQFDRPDFVIKPKLEDKQVSIEFKFKNIGNHPVTVTAINASCDCAKVKLEKKTFQAGEQDKIVVTVDTEHFRARGVHQKNLAVQTDDKDRSTYLLWFRIDYSDVEALLSRPALTVEPRGVSWLVDSDKASKSILLTLLPNSPVKIVGVASKNERVKATLEPVVAGKEYKIILQPTDTSQPFVARVEIKTEPELRGTAIQEVFVVVASPQQDKPATQPAP